MCDPELNLPCLLREYTHSLIWRQIIRLCLLLEQRSYSRRHNPIASISFFGESPNQCISSKDSRLQSQSTSRPHNVESMVCLRYQLKDIPKGTRCVRILESCPQPSILLWLWNRQRHSKQHTPIEYRIPPYTGHPVQRVTEHPPGGAFLGSTEQLDTLLSS